MLRMMSVAGAAAIVAVAAGPNPSAGQTAAAMSPAAGYSIHVTAPHLVKGVPMGPYHHYCKVISAEPVIQCLVYSSTEPNARLEQIEYIIAKSITRTAVTRERWNMSWHDHRQEIATGRVEVHDLPPDKAKAVADLVATTDGIIFHLWSHDEKVPSSKVTIAQSVGHVSLTPSAFHAGGKEKPPKP